MPLRHAPDELGGDGGLRRLPAGATHLSRLRRLILPAHFMRKGPGSFAAGLEYGTESHGANCPAVKGVCNGHALAVLRHEATTPHLLFCSRLALSSLFCNDSVDHVRNCGENNQDATQHRRPLNLCHLVEHHHLPEENVLVKLQQTAGLIAVAGVGLPPDDHLLLGILCCCCVLLLRSKDLALPRLRRHWRQLRFGIRWTLIVVLWLFRQIQLPECG